MDQFYVQLEGLDNIANVRLPAIADSIAKADGQLKEAVGWITRTFDTRGRSYRDEAWDARQTNLYYLFWRPGNECYYTMDFMRQIFQDNVENVNLAAGAMREIAARYRAADGQGNVPRWCRARDRGRWWHAHRPFAHRRSTAHVTARPGRSRHIRGPAGCGQREDGCAERVRTVAQRGPGASRASIAARASA